MWIPYNIIRSLNCQRAKKSEREWEGMECGRHQRTFARPVTRPATRCSRKEVIQPQVPLRLPCYDFAPVTELTFDGCPLAVSPPASGPPSFHGVTGGVYKARERIHRGVADPRLLAIPAACGPGPHHNPAVARLVASGELFLVGDGLYRPLSRVCRPGRHGHDDLTSSPPPSGLTPADSLEFPP